MTDEEYDLLDHLMVGTRDLFAVLYAQQAVLNESFGDTWRPSVSAVQEELAPYIDELFEPIRDEVCGAFDQSRPSANLRRIVRRMVDSAAHPRV